MKKNKKKFIIIAMLIVLLGSIIFPKSSIAAGNTVELYATHRFNDLLVRNGMKITCLYIVYQKDGVEYPSYCLNLELDGATLDYSYSVNIDNLITDMEIWRTVVNGYPYKTPQELGCNTKEEAYLATRQAVYCAVYDRDPNSYGAGEGEAGQRTLRALKQIVNAARTSNEVKPSSTLNIHSDSSTWAIDNIEKNYVSKVFTVNAAASVKDYQINLAGTEIDGIKVVDLQNKEKSTFSGNEKFKILIPVTNIKEDGNFTITAKGEVATKPVYYGKAPNDTLQNTAITGAIYEMGTGTKTEYYFKNESKINILKQNQKTKEPLVGVKFQILNEKKQVVYADLTTNSEGKITVENLLPGKYYVQEIETLEGYQVYEKLIETDVKLNEEVSITVNNLHNEDIAKIEKTSTEIEVGQAKSEIKIEQNSVKVGEKENKVKIKENKTDIKTIENEVEVDKSKTKIKVAENDINVKDNNTRIVIEDNNINVEKTKTTIKLPKTGM